MRTVQVAIKDVHYAHSVRDLLLQDGTHQVHLLDKPDVTLGGVIVTDALHLNRLPSLAYERDRLVVMVHEQRDDLSKIWDAGVRHVLFHGDPPLTARIAVIGLEMRLREKAPAFSA